MFKCVFAFFALVAACSATPGLLYPVATSYASRVDINSRPILAYSAPVLKSGIIAAPLTYGYGNGYGLGYSYGLGYGRGLGYGNGYKYGPGYGHSLNYGHGLKYYGYGSGAYGYGNGGYLW